ncbi:MAG TPA: energy transducer TonB [Bryobacteraceae bacterium]|nr:energy transducer TonB [Bryobacteraceae bacterium]
METVGQPPAEAELQLLTDWSDPDARSRHRKAAAGAIGINVAIVVAMWLLPETFFKPPDLPEVAQRVTPLVMPLPELTQRDPNPGKVRKEFEVQAPVAPRRTLQMPPSPAPVKGEETPKPQPAPPPPLPEPPKVETARETPPQDLLREVQQTAPPPQPQIQTAEKPSLTFENPPPPRSAPVPIEQRRIPLPTASIGDIARSAVMGTPVGTIIGDPGAWGSAYNGMTQSSTPGNPAAAVQLRSDAEGVDFKPYLLQLIATIKRNWLAVIPESARMGSRGKVSLQFVIAKNGNIDKVVYAEQSGSNALDRAAVAGVSASNPLPPLPREFKGNRIVLQLNFVYR